MGAEKALAAMAGCTPYDQSVGGCSTGTIADDHVDVGASTGDDSDRPATGPLPAGDDDAVAIAEDPVGERNATTCKGAGRCEINLDDTESPPPPAPGVTMSDLASFYPQKPTVTGEPNGWAIIGLDTNFVSSAAVHKASGSLAGRSADVRFTPQRFLWDYGDGIRVTTTTGGSSWEQLGVPEFTATATSHVYSASGAYRVQLTVEYTAQYRIGAGPWQGVPGTLRVSAPTTTVIAADAKTVLVQRDCAVDPRGPGC